MMRQRYGRIVCMSSGAREGTPWTAYYQGGAAYSASKAGVHGFVRDVALELAEHGVNVNAVAPGPIDTDLNPAAGDWATPQIANTALKRYGSVDDIAAMVAFVAGPEASYITGANLTVDGGTNA